MAAAKEHMNAVKAVSAIKTVADISQQFGVLEGLLFWIGPHPLTQI
jgi:hypothetical protein